MTYPSSSPWGPHGPQVPAHSVTPNPTPASAPYVPTPSAPAPVDYGTGRGDYRGGSSSSASGPAAPPRPKSVVVAVILSVLFAPAAIWYASFGTRQFISGMLFTGIAIILMVARPTLGIPLIVISLIWSVSAVKRFNRELKETQKPSGERQ